MYQLKYDILSHINLRKENVFNRWKENVISSSDQYIRIPSKHMVDSCSI